MDWLNLAKLVGGGAGAAFTGGATLPMAMQGASGLLSGAAKGSADERGKENAAIQSKDTLRNQQYGTKQSALLQALLGRSNEATSRYGTKQGATTGAMQGLQGATSRALEAGSNEGIELARLGLAVPALQAKQSIMGSLMKNMQPHQFNAPARQAGHLTQVRGGMSAANLDPGTRELGARMIEEALKDPNGKIPKATNFMGGVQDWKSSVLDSPQATDYSKGLLNPPELQDYKKAGRGESILSSLGLGLGLAGEVMGGIGGMGGGGGGQTNPFVGPIEPEAPMW